jgi:hypothetical protein
MSLRKFVPALAGAAVAVVLTLAGTAIAATGSGTPQPPGRPAPAAPAVTAASLCQNLWAVVNADGSLARAGCPGTTSAIVGSGFEVIFPHNVRLCAYVASVGDSGSFITPPSGEASADGRLTNVDGVFVQTYDSAGTTTHQTFHLVVQCPTQKRSGTVTIPAGNKVATVSVSGGLSSSSVALATAQSNRGVFVVSATPSTATGKVTIRLNKASSHSVVVGWSVVN